MFHSYEDVTIAGEVLQILTYALHSRPLSILQRATPTVSWGILHDLLKIMFPLKSEAPF